MTGLGSWGPLSLFGTDADGSLGHISQTAPNGAWSSWEDTEVEIGSSPSAFQNADGRLEVFAIGPDGHLGHMYQPSTGPRARWSDWESLDAVIVGDPVVFQNRDGRLEVFAIGVDGRLGHTWQLNPGGLTGWTTWTQLGPGIQLVPSVVRNADGRLEVFALDRDGRLGHVWQLDPNVARGWSEWDSFGHVLGSAPTAVQNADGRVEVFAIGSSGRLGHVWQDKPGGMAGWSDWGEFAHVLESPPAVFPNSDGRLEVFALAGDGRLGHVWQLEPGGMSGWSDWHSFEHAIRSAPAVSAAADGRLEVFAIGPNGRLGHVWQQDRHASGDWSDWEDLGPPISERRLAVCQSGGQANLDLGALAKVQSRANSGWPSEMSSELSADFCVIGAGPAGITVSDRLARTGARVVLIESGSWGDNFDAQELNHGDAYGPILKGYLKYLRRGRHRQVQGSASGWRRGWCMPFRAIDYEQRPWVTHSGWPLGADDLQPYEQQAAATLGFDAFEPVQPEGSLIRLTYRYPPDPLVFQAMFLELLEMPDFRAELGCTAVELKISGDQVKSVRVARLAGGELHIEADTIVLAAGGVENARLLLLNEPALPIRNETVGRFFMEHPHVLAGTVRLPDAEALRPYLGGDGQLDVLSLADTAQREERLLNASVQLRPVGPGAEELLGPVECELFVRAEQAPNPNSRVSLGEATDSFGCPQPVLNWDLLDHDWASVVRTAELVAFVLDKRYNATSRLAINLDRPWPWDPAGPAESANPTWGNHHLGTTRMAEQPSEGVVDRNCLVHGTANLYVAGSSVFPTGGCANPTFEIVTLAHRLADHLSAGG